MVKPIILFWSLKPRKTMNTLDQEKAIAEACGVKPELVEWWAHKPDDTGGRLCMSAPTKEQVEKWIKENPKYAEGYTPKAFYRYPRYSESLDAMRTAEATIAPSEDATDDELSLWGSYERELNRVCLRDCRDGAGRDERQILATAPQRAEAFLRTFGRWIETPAANNEENKEAEPSSPS